ncbi:heme A synthase [Planktotalea arctica]|uniref:heme A synthase n=1 Tax=Planktotalea arctica TaxID=1481893 RepID=UPI000A16EAF3|nr:heme A synthase [Planktotalea arctica]
MSTSKKRSIFEEVDTAEKGAPVTGVIDAGKRGARRGIRIWLTLLFALLVVMIAVGGLTRLTDSGLSITEWKPVTGAMPPLSAAEWDSEFDKYRAIPEYQLQNKGMSLSEFQFIYWWEWGHRQLGRVIGLVWAIGFFGFLLTRNIPAGWTGRLLGLGALGGLQGAIGWWMVSSGLTGGMLDVASYRLATHLGLAFVILGLIAWYMFELKCSERQLMQCRRHREVKLFSMSTGFMHFTFLQILLGALVAGIDAGRSYTDWPLMAGNVLPPYPFEMTPIWRNFFENAGLVQFMHRVAGYLLFAFGIVIWLRARRSPNSGTRRAFSAVIAMMSVQMLLGIVTVLYAAPWHIAIVHQLGAVVLWVLVLRARFYAGYPTPDSLRGAV